MNEFDSVDRRVFHQLTTAAFMGMAAGMADATEAVGEQLAGKSLQKGQGKPVDRGNPLLIEPNICRGLNTCKGKGRGGANQCVGTSICALVATHVFAGHNDCRGQGACNVGDPAQFQVNYPGENTCKGKGACGVPIPPEKDVIWQQARRRFEALVSDAGGKAGPAPRRPTG